MHSCRALFSLSAQSPSSEAAPGSYWAKQWCTGSVQAPACDLSERGAWCFPVDWLRCPVCTGVWWLLPPSSASSLFLSHVLHPHKPSALLIHLNTCFIESQTSTASSVQTSLDQYYKNLNWSNPCRKIPPTEFFSVAFFKHLKFTPVKKVIVFFIGNATETHNVES